MPAALMLFVLQCSAIMKGGHLQYYVVAVRTMVIDMEIGMNNQQAPRWIIRINEFEKRGEVMLTQIPAAGDLQRVESMNDASSMQVVMHNFCVAFVEAAPHPAVRQGSIPNLQRGKPDVFSPWCLSTPIQRIVLNQARQHVRTAPCQHG